MWPFWSKAVCEEEEAVVEVEETVEATEEAAEEEPAPVEEEKKEVELKTAPYDQRFPTTNQARNCFTRYNEFHKCAKEKDAEDPACVKYASYYRAICPTEWVDKWNEQRENGTWMGKY